MREFGYWKASLAPVMSSAACRRPNGVSPSIRTTVCVRVRQEPML